MNNRSNRLLTWDDTFTVNNHEIDLEHDKLIEALNDLYELSLLKKDVYCIIEKFESFNTLVSNHFLNEEKILVEILPIEKFKAHRNIHKNLLKQLADFLYLTINGQVIPEGFFPFIKTWFITEIIGADKASFAYQADFAAKTLLKKGGAL
ncbi:MAG: bacteriohemerythrin [Pseudobdellovibrio sp.]